MVFDFIQENKEQCVIATGNMDCWVDKLVERIGCTAFCSTGLIENNKIAKVTKIFRKETVVQKYQKEGYEVVFIGDGNNDMEAMRLAEYSIASGLTHYPAKSVLTVADYLIFNEIALCRQLNQLL
jgi:phosphoserine phosphatase